MKREDLQQQDSAKNKATEDYIRKLEKENEKLKRQVGTDQVLFEAIKSELPTFAPLEPVRYAAPKQKGRRPLLASLVVTDQHYEESVSREEMEGMAEYNPRIAQERMNQTTQKALSITSILRDSSQIDELQVWSLGDWFCGKIHPQEEAWGVSMPMPVAVPTVAISFAKMVTELAAHFKRVKITGVCGNHGRETKKVVTKMTADRNWDMSVYLIAREITKQLPNVEWNIPHSIMTVVDAMGHGCLLTHSGEVNMNNRTPYYPIENTLDLEKRTRSGTGNDFEYAFMGHWHHEAVLAGYIFLNPCMIGPNQFSRYKLHRPSKPQQKIYFWDEQHGPAWAVPIDLD